MRLARPVVHAVYILCHLSRQGPRAIATARAVAGAVKVPLEQAAKILQTLTSAGLVRSVRGRCGGYALLKRLDVISVAEVCDAVAPTGRQYELEARACPLVPDEECATRGGLILLHDRLREVLAGTSVAAITDREACRGAAFVGALTREACEQSPGGLAVAS